MWLLCAEEQLNKRCSTSSHLSELVWERERYNLQYFIYLLCIRFHYLIFIFQFHQNSQCRSKFFLRIRTIKYANEFLFMLKACICYFPIILFCFSISYRTYVASFNGMQNQFFIQKIALYVRSFVLMVFLSFPFPFKCNCTVLFKFFFINNFMKILFPEFLFVASVFLLFCIVIFSCKTKDALCSFCVRLSLFHVIY